MGWLQKMTTANEYVKSNIDLLVKALEQYWQLGKVVNVKCDRCGGLIKVKPQGEMVTAFSSNCPWGLS